MNAKTLLPALLALGITAASIAGSACFTATTISSTQPRTEARTPALRVRHCYLTPKHQLLVLAEGGAWRADAGKTPREKISFALELDALAAQPGRGVKALPQDILHAGWPDAEFLRANGYAEVAFAERESFAPAADPAQRAQEQAAVLLVRYQGVLWLPAPEGYLGLRPAFTVQNASGLPVLPFSVADTHTSRNLGPLLLIPLTVPLDVVTAPLQLIFLLSYKGG